MKICTITCNNAENHGARLQTFALARFLSDDGHDVEVIDYNPDYVRFNIKYIYNPGLNIKEWVKLFIRFPDRWNRIQRHKLFTAFSKEYIPLTPKVYRSYESLCAAPPEADVYICGSDQIWNMTFHNGHDDAFYLAFGNPATKRLSYAASFAFRKLDDNDLDFVRQRITKLDGVSVREHSAVEITRDLGVKSVRVCDPVFLLDASVWHNMADKYPVTHSDYILVYDFMQSKEIAQIAKRMASITGSKIFSVSPYRLNYADKNFTACRPEEFLSLIKNARCVISNSFHSTAFAMIFERDFFVVNRSDGLNERMRDLLSAYNLFDHIIDVDSGDYALSSHVDYAAIGKSLAADADRSRSWLRSHLS